MSEPIPGSDQDLARTRIRNRWEFASVLNFLHVFQSVVGGDVKVEGEQIETALISPNEVLKKLHVALLKGIPPVAKNLTVADAWVTVLCKKLDSWWQWVAEGENPLKADHGKEIQIYKDLDPITRMMILKALCEVRAEQDDIVRYIGDEIKKGTNVSTFRKERIGSDGKGVNYWYDGDPIIGHRLYKEIVCIESKKKPNGKGRALQPTNDCQWETVATEFHEFQEISDNLSSSKINAEAGVGDIIKTEIVPVLEQLWKKKERAMKRQERQAQELHNVLNYSQIGTSRSCRERRPVCYTFDDYDRCIEEAIEVTKNLKTERPKKRNHESLNHLSDKKDAPNGSSEKLDQDNSETDEADHNETKHRRDDSEDDDYNVKDEGWSEGNIEEEEEEEAAEEEDDDDDKGNDSFTSSEDSPKQARNRKIVTSKVAAGPRRSERVVPTKVLAETKKRLRQRVTRNSAQYSTQIISDSEESLPENSKQIVVSDTDSDSEESSAENSKQTEVVSDSDSSSDD